jgi:hypothetical protein
MPEIYIAILGNQPKTAHEIVRIFSLTWLSIPNYKCYDLFNYQNKSLTLNILVRILLILGTVLSRESNIFNYKKPCLYGLTLLDGY